MKLKINMRFAVIIVLALFLRAVNVSTIPMWDWDEGGNINYASNLGEGKIQYFSYRYHFISHPPFYFLLLSVWFKLLGANIMVLRWFSITCSIISLILAYKIVKSVLDEDSALLTALVYAVGPELIFWGRLGFANSLMAVIVLGSIYFLHRFLVSSNKKDLYYCSFLTGLCPITEYTGIVFALTLALILYWYSRKLLIRAMVIVAVPFTAFIILMLAFDGKGFIKDAWGHFGVYPLAVPALIIGALLVRRLSDRVLGYIKSIYVMGRKETPAELILFLLVIVLSIVPLESGAIYSGKFSSTVFMMSVLGLLFIKDMVFRSVMIVYSLGYFMLLISLNRWDHMSILLQYILPVNAVFLMNEVRFYLSKHHPRYVYVIMVLPFAASAWVVADGFMFNGLCETPSEQFNELNGFINQRISDEDLVVTFTYLSQGIKAKTVPFPQVLMYHGYRFGYLNRDYEQSEFIYNLSLGNIDYMVLPEGLIEELGTTGYGNITRQVQNWTIIYELHTIGEHSSTLETSILSIIGATQSCERHYIVLENPARAQQ